MSNVKARRYDASRRQAQAERSRQAILDAAERQFLAIGYAATTVAGIADEADVSVDTVYKAFGGKAGLVRSIHDRGLLGRGPVPAYQRSDDIRAHETDPRALMRKWGSLTAEVTSRVSPIMLLVRSAAAADTEMAALLEDSNAQRLKRMRHNARALAERGWLRADVSVARAADVMWTCSSPELFEVLVLQRGWSLRRFGGFVADLMSDALLPE